MKGAAAIVFGLLGAWPGNAELRKALKTGTSYGWDGIRYPAVPGSAMYRMSLGFRATFTLLAAAVVWIGIETLSS
jgi:hypothetical protein